MKQAYIYPVTSKVNIINNPYIKDFIQSLTDTLVFVNSDKPANNGIFDILKYINKTDIVFLNWIEDLPDKKGGLLQSIFFVFLLVYLKIKRIKIIYTIHNSQSHRKNKILLKNTIRRLVYRFSDQMLTHSLNGLNILPSKKLRAKTKYIPHPFPNTIIEAKSNLEKKYDLFIWGAIQPYKGIDRFLEFLNTCDELKQFKILIAGKISPKEYEEKILCYHIENLTILNQFIDDHLLNELIDSSQVVLFSYLGHSVLSSGALTYSLSRKSLIIGPDVGAFHDMKNEKLIETYHNYTEVSELYKTLLKDKEKYLSRMNDYINANTWESFSKKIENTLK